MGTAVSEAKQERGKDRPVHREKKWGFREICRKRRNGGKLGGLVAWVCSEFKQLEVNFRVEVNLGLEIRVLEWFRRGGKVDRDWERDSIRSSREKKRGWWRRCG